MPQQVHFEVFSRRGSKGGWNLVDVRQARDDAIAFAQELMGSGATGVKVHKETYNEDTGDYLSLKIFEDGHNKMKMAPAQDDFSPSPPCFKPDDLYSYHSRKTIAEIMPDFLRHYKVTVTELGHRADLLEKLEASGNILQFAIQRVAVAQAATSEQQVQQIIKKLNELTTQAFNRVYRDTRKGRFPWIKPGEFRPLANKLSDQSDGRYILNGAIALYLSDAKGWDEKVLRLMELMAEADGDGAGAMLLLAAIDSIMSEVLNGPAALRELIGQKQNHGAAVMSLVKLFLGHEPDDAEGRQGLISLTHRFAADALPDSRGAIADRIVAEIRSFKRLCPESLDQEFKMLRQIANLVVTGVGKYLSHQDLVHAFVTRSKRLVTNENIGAYLKEAASPDEKLERLLFMEENIIGAENKRLLATFVIPIVTSAVFEDHFTSPKTPLTARLQRLAALNLRVHRSGFQENQRDEIARIVDRIACGVEAKGGLLESINKSSRSHVEKANVLLSYFNANTFTEPALSAKARELVVGYLTKPGFLQEYVAQASRGIPDGDKAVDDLIQTLQKIGITEANGLKSVAA
ncbi:MAG TPA: hypothetical protein VMU01_02110 [Rhizomicrobium sp.]|nr:hypothetical protein [Rhizomicrobium sp.]